MNGLAEVDVGRWEANGEPGNEWKQLDVERRRQKGFWVGVGGVGVHKFWKIYGPICAWAADLPGRLYAG
jgi:hypothetical protein